MRRLLEILGIVTPRGERDWGLSVRAHTALLVILVVTSLLALPSIASDKRPTMIGLLLLLLAINVAIIVAHARSDSRNS